jgi:hypothetical protein
MVSRRPFVSSRGQEKCRICRNLRDTTRHDWTIRSALQAGGRRFDPGRLHSIEMLQRGAFSAMRNRGGGDFGLDRRA